MKLVSAGVFFLFFFYLSLVENFSHLSWARQQQPQEQHYPCLTECTIFFCPYYGIAASAWNFWWWCMQWHMGCTKTQLGEKSLAAPGSPTCYSSSPHAWLLGPSLHQQSHILPAPCIHFDRELFVTCTVILLTGLFAVPLSHYFTVAFSALRISVTRHSATSSTFLFPLFSLCLSLSLCLYLMYWRKLVFYFLC